MKTVLLLDPFIMVNDTKDYWPYETARNQDIFIKWPKNFPNPDYADTNTSAMLGYVRIILSRHWLKNFLS